MTHGAGAATASVGAGARISAALSADGTVRTWGDDTQGALGIGRPLNFASPAQVPGLTGVTAIAAGASYVLALKNDGTVVAWGNNDAGQLGDGTFTSRSLPTPVVGLDNVDSIAASINVSLAIRRDGTLWQWGQDPLPAQVEGLSDMVQVVAGYGHVLARKRDGTVWAWGQNESGQFGDGTVGEPYVWHPTPVQAIGITNAIAIAVGAWHSLALLGDGTVMAWGTNEDNALGIDASTPLRATPAPVPGISGATEIYAGHTHSFAKRSDGTVFGWGANGYAGIGDGTYDNRPSPVVVPALAGVASIAPGFLHHFARASDGTLLGWGLNDNGQLGDPAATSSRPTPTRLPGFSGARAVSVGALFTAALKTDGTVWTWGDNAFGQLGNNALTFRSTPSIVSLSGVQQLVVGGFHMVALKTDGSIVAWGDSRSGQIGDGTSVNRSSPVAVTGMGAGSGVVEIAAGGLLTLARKSDGSVYSWGDTYTSAVGQREIDDGSVPSRVVGISDAIAISAGGVHAVVLKSDRTVWTWGENSSGQLGDGTRFGLYEGRKAPAPVPGLANVRRISAGGSHTVVMKDDGSLWGWGSNAGGQLGDGTFVDRLSPVRVAPAITDVVDFVAGDVFTLVLRSDGSVWGFGASWSYKLGSNGGGDYADPVRIPGLEGIAHIAAGAHGFAWKTDGTVLAWGLNASGELGDGTLVDRADPVVVLREGGAGTLASNDWYLDVEPSIATEIKAEKIPVFQLIATGRASAIDAAIRYRPQDVGSVASTYVFALAPASQVKNARGAKDGGCVLAQVGSDGSLSAVSASTLQAATTGVLAAQGQSVTILNNATSQLAGATFFVGYGSGGQAMLASGTNRSAVTVPGGTPCVPQKPQTGWWWNPREGGRGFSIEVQGNHIFFAAYHYDVSGRATWNVAAGVTSLDGSRFSGDLLGVRGGQTLGGVPTVPQPATTVGPITLEFSDATHGTMVWPGGTVAIERFIFRSDGAAQATQPESGWWWNPNENGRGFFMEWQNGTADVAGYMYDDAGNPVWYVSVYETPNPRSFSGNWWQFANGQSINAPYQPATQVSDHVAPVTITFSAPDTALMTLPNGRSTSLTRLRF